MAIQFEKKIKCWSGSIIIEASFSDLTLYVSNGGYQSSATLALEEMKKLRDILNATITLIED